MNDYKQKDVIISPQIELKRIKSISFATKSITHNSLPIDGF